MRLALLTVMLTLAAPGAAQQDTPYYPRETKADQDMGALNQNFRDLADRNRDEVDGAQVPGNKCFGADVLCYNDAQRRIDVNANGINFTNTTGNALTFQDGTTQNTAAVSTSAYVSSFGFIAGGASGTGLNVCVSGSSRTATVTRSFVDVIFSGSGRGSAASIGASFLINGDFPSGLDSDTGVTDAYMSAGSENANLSFTYTRLPVTPGSITICLTGSGGATMTFCTDMGIKSKCRFGFRESD